MCVSAVNSRFGRILLVCRRLPVSKFSSVRARACSVPNLLAGDLTQNQVVALELCDNEFGTSSSKLRYVAYVWSANTSLGQLSQIVVAGNLKVQKCALRCTLTCAGTKA